MADYILLNLVLSSGILAFSAFGSPFDFNLSCSIRGCCPIKLGVGVGVVILVFMLFCMYTVKSYC